MTVKRKRPPECPIERFIAVISGRWKAMILWRLFVEPQRYSSLTAMVDGVSERALSQALAELAQDRIIRRDQNTWTLTPLGEAMRPALSAMFAWGALAETMSATADVDQVHIVE